MFSIKKNLYLKVQNDYTLKESTYKNKKTFNMWCERVLFGLTNRIEFDLLYWQNLP